MLGKTADGALAISALGVSGVETVRPIAFGTPSHGALRAYDTTVTKSLQGAQNSLPRDRGRAHRQAALPAEPGLQPGGQPDLEGLPDRTALQPAERVPVELPEHGHARHVLLDRDRGLHERRRGRDDRLRRRRRLEDAVGRPARPVTGANLGTTQTEGNNVDDARVWSGNHGVYGNPALFRDSSATRDYQPAWTNAWYTSGCNPNNVNAAVNPAGNDIEASTASMFVGHNRMHDFSYYLGFDEGHWNAQQYNNGVTTVDPTPTPGGPVIAAPLANDGLIGNAQSGAATGSRDNANMSTGADGPHPTTNQFVWQPLAGSFYAPCVDGAYDFTVYGHEFGHLIENRMIGKGVGARQGTARRRDGRGVRRLRRARGRQRAARRRSPGADRYTEGAYATGNRLQRHPRLPRGPADGRRVPASPARIPTPTRSTTATSASTSSAPRCTPTARSGSRSQIDLRDLFLAAVPVAGAAEDIACVRGQHGREHLPGRPPVDPGLLRLDGDDAARPDDDPGARRDARRGHGPLRRRQPGPDLAGLRDARLRPAPEHGQQRRRESGAGLLVAAWRTTRR